MSDSQHDGEAVENPEDDPEIAALLDFEPVPRKSSPQNAWTPDAQRKLIALLAVTGAQGKACGFIGKDRGGAKKLYDSPEGGSFRAAWHAAIELYQRRREEKYGDGPPPERTPPTVDGRWKYPPPIHAASAGGEGQVLNEFGEWEDEESLNRRAEEARDNIARKLLMARRLYLREISGSAGKRAAFEILTDLPVDWEKAKALEQQPDEPWRRVNMRQPDMLMTAENGWMADIVGGPEDIARHKAKVRAAIDEYHAERGMPPVDWESDDE